MALLSFINALFQEQPVSTTAPLPTQAIDGYSSAAIGIATVSGGATPVVLASAPGKAIDLFNNTGTDLEYQRGGSGAYFPIPNGTARTIPAIGGNANTIGVRRVDQTATTVSLRYEVLS